MRKLILTLVVGAAISSGSFAGQNPQTKQNKDSAVTVKDMISGYADFCSSLGEDTGGTRYQWGKTNPYCRFILETDPNNPLFYDWTATPEIDKEKAANQAKDKEKAIEVLGKEKDPINKIFHNLAGIIFTINAHLHTYTKQLENKINEQQIQIDKQGKEIDNLTQTVARLGIPLHQDKTGMSK